MNLDCCSRNLCHLALPRTFIDQLNRFLLSRRITSRRTCLLWQIDLHGPSNSDSTVPPTLQQMFALARKMGYEMRPIARRSDNTRQRSGSPRAPFTPDQGYRPPFRPGRDFSRIKCFSCGQFEHTQAHCPRPDLSLPYKPAGWNMQSDNQQHQDNYLDRDLTLTGLNAIHQGSNSSSPCDHTLHNSTRKSDSIDTIQNTDSNNRNYVLCLDQSVILD